MSTTENSDFGAPQPGTIPTLAEEFAAQTIAGQKPEPPAAAAEADVPERTEVIVHPLTGGVLELDAPTDQLAAVLEEHREILSVLAEWRSLVERELVRRMDSANTRKEEVGGYLLEVNAPRTESYSVDAMREALAPLVDEGILDEVVLERVITMSVPKPVAPQERVAKTEVNKLKKHPEEAVRAAIAEACEEIPNNRTLKIGRVA